MTDKFGFVQVKQERDFVQVKQERDTDYPSSKILEPTIIPSSSSSSVEALQGIKLMVSNRPFEKTKIPRRHEGIRPILERVKQEQNEVSSSSSSSSRNKNEDDIVISSLTSHQMAPNNNTVTTTVGDNFYYYQDHQYGPVVMGHSSSQDRQCGPIVMGHSSSQGHQYQYGRVVMCPSFCQDHQARPIIMCHSLCQQQVKQVISGPSSLGRQDQDYQNQMWREEELSKVAPNLTTFTRLVPEYPLLSFDSSPPSSTVYNGSQWPHDLDSLTVEPAVEEEARDQWKATQGHSSRSNSGHHHHQDPYYLTSEGWSDHRTNCRRARSRSRDSGSSSSSFIDTVNMKVTVSSSLRRRKIDNSRDDDDLRSHLMERRRRGRSRSQRRERDRSPTTSFLISREREEYARKLKRQERFRDHLDDKVGGRRHQRTMDNTVTVRFPSRVLRIDWLHNDGLPAFKGARRRCLKRDLFRYFKSKSNLAKAKNGPRLLDVKMFSETSRSTYLLFETPEKAAEALKNILYLDERERVFVIYDELSSRTLSLPYRVDFSSRPTWTRIDP